jgi:hypothetical protein
VHDLERLVQENIVEGRVIVVTKPFVYVTVEDRKPFAHTNSNASIVNFHATDI